MGKASKAVKSALEYIGLSIREKRKAFIESLTAKRIDAMNHRKTKAKIKEDDRKAKFELEKEDRLKLQSELKEKRKK